MLLSGRKISAAEGHALGFVNEVCAPDRLMETTLRWADDILAASPLAVRATKSVAMGLASIGLADASERQWAYPRFA